MGWRASRSICQQALGFCQKLFQVTVYGARLSFLQQQFRIALDRVQWRAQVVAELADRKLAEFTGFGLLTRSIGQLFDQLLERLRGSAQSGKVRL